MAYTLAIFQDGELLSLRGMDYDNFSQEFGDIPIKTGYKQDTTLFQDASEVKKAVIDEGLETGFWVLSQNTTGSSAFILGSIDYPPDIAAVIYFLPSDNVHQLAYNSIFTSQPYIEGIRQVSNKKWAMIISQDKIADDNFQNNWDESPHQTQKEKRWREEANIKKQKIAAHNADVLELAEKIRLAQKEADYRENLRMLAKHGLVPIESDKQQKQPKPSQLFNQKLESAKNQLPPSTQNHFLHLEISLFLENFDDFKIYNNIFTLTELPQDQNYFKPNAIQNLKEILQRGYPISLTGYSDMDADSVENLYYLLYLAGLSFDELATISIHFLSSTNTRKQVIEGFIKSSDINHHFFGNEAACKKLENIPNLKLTTIDRDLNLNDVWKAVKEIPQIPLETESKTKTRLDTVDPNETAIVLAEALKTDIIRFEKIFEELSSFTTAHENNTSFNQERKILSDLPPKTGARLPEDSFKEIGRLSSDKLINEFHKIVSILANIINPYPELHSNTRNSNPVHETGIEIYKALCSCRPNFLKNLPPEQLRVLCVYSEGFLTFLKCAEYAKQLWPEPEQSDEGIGQFNCLAKKIQQCIDALKAEHPSSPDLYPPMTSPVKCAFHFQFSTLTKMPLSEPRPNYLKSKTIETLRNILKTDHCLSIITDNEDELKSALRKEGQGLIEDEISKIRIIDRSSFTIKDLIGSEPTKHYYYDTMLSGIYYIELQKETLAADKQELNPIHVPFRGANPDDSWHLEQALQIAQANVLTQVNPDNPSLQTEGLPFNENPKNEAVPDNGIEPSGKDQALNDKALKTHKTQVNLKPLPAGITPSSSPRTKPRERHLLSSPLLWAGLTIFAMSGGLIASIWSVPIVLAAAVVAIPLFTLLALSTTLLKLKGLWNQMSSKSSLGSYGWGGLTIVMLLVVAVAIAMAAFPEAFAFMSPVMEFIQHFIRTGFSQMGIELMPEVVSFISDAVITVIPLVLAVVTNDCYVQAKMEDNGDPEVNQAQPDNRPLIGEKQNHTRDLTGKLHPNLFAPRPITELSVVEESVTSLTPTLTPGGDMVNQ